VWNDQQFGSSEASTRQCSRDIYILINYAHRKKNFRQVFQKYSSDKMLEVANIPVIMRREAYEQQ